MSIVDVLGKAISMATKVNNDPNFKKAKKTVTKIAKDDRVRKVAFDVAFSGKSPQKAFVDSALHIPSLEPTPEDYEYYESRGCSTEYLDEYYENYEENMAEGISYEDYEQYRCVEDYGLCDDELGDEDRDDS